MSLLARCVACSVARAGSSRTDNHPTLPQLASASPPSHFVMCPQLTKLPKKSPLTSIGATERSRAHNYHNHPAGIAEPSQADRALTRRLIDALALVDIRTVDHLVVAGIDSVSFAERGWL